MTPFGKHIANLSASGPTIGLVKVISGNSRYEAVAIKTINILKIYH